MDCTANRQALLDAFAIVSSVVPSRSPKPILQHIKLVATIDGCYLLATDLEVWIRRELSGVEVRVPGTVILPREKVGSVLRNYPGADLDFTTNDDRILTVNGLHASFKFTSEDPDLFPEFPAPPATAGRQIAADALRTLIRRTVFCTDVDATRYALGGCLLEAGDDTLLMVGTDGRRLAHMEAALLPSDAPPVDPLAAKPVIPVKALKLIERALCDSDAPITVAWDAMSAFFSCPQTRISTRLVEGRYPRWRDVFPVETGRAISLEVGEFQRALSQAMIATSDESRGIDLLFEWGKLTLSGTAADVGSSRITMDLLAGETEGMTPITVTMDPRYALDFLKVLDPAAVLVFGLIDDKAPCVFKLDDYRTVVMPLTRDR